MNEVSDAHRAGEFLDGAWLPKAAQWYGFLLSQRDCATAP
jgi:hypothetical protein